MAWHTVAAAVGGLAVSGVTNKALGTTPQAVDTRECPLLARSTHEPDFITDVVNCTSGNSRRDYTLNYKYFYAPVGKDRALFATEVENATTLEALLDEMLRNRRLGGAKYIALANMPVFRTVLDASGKEFHGAVIALRVTEY